MTLSVLLLDDQLTTGWDEFVQANQGNGYLLSQWKDVIESAFGHRSYYLACLNEDQKIVGVLPLVQQKSLVFGNFLTSIPFFNYGGLLTTSNESADALLEYAENLRKQLGCSHVELRMESAIDGHVNHINHDNCRTDKVTMLLELPEESDALWQAIGSKRRAQVKRPIREGAEFKVGSLELLDDFYKVFARNMRDLGTPVYSRRFFKEVLQRLRDNAYLAIVYIKEEPVGCGFLVRNNDRIEIPWASTNRDFNRFGVNMFLYWKILEHAIDQKAKIFDFGRSSKDAGTLKFKKQWGATQHQLYWYYLLPKNEKLPQINHQNSRFQLMINTWKKLPVAIANLIGPLVVKNIP